MPGYLLDTNHLGRLVDLRHPLRARLRTAIEAGDVFYIILPIITETAASFSILPRAAQSGRYYVQLSHYHQLTKMTL